jgi:phosphatidylserine decarboxylase
VTIAREGWPVIGATAGVLGVVGIVGAAAGHPMALLPLIAGIGFCLWFFRDPERTAPSDERLVVSPADGRVVAVVEEREEQFLHALCTRISIFMSPLDVHVNRNPVSGAVLEVRHTPGKFTAAFKDKASLDNERNAVVLRRGERRYMMVQIAGALARRIVCHLAPGDRVQRGERFGMIMFGSRVDVFLPADVTPLVAKGARVKAGASALARAPE